MGAAWWSVSCMGLLAGCASTVAASTEGGVAPDVGAAPDAAGRTVVVVRVGPSGPTEAGVGFEVVAVVRGRPVTCRTDERGRCELPVASSDVESVTVERSDHEIVSVVAPLPVGEVGIVARPRQSSDRSSGPILQFEPPTPQASLLTASGGFFVLPAAHGTTLYGLPAAPSRADFVASTMSPTEGFALSTARAVAVPSSPAALRLPAPQPVGVRPATLALALPGPVRLTTTTAQLARVELDRPAGEGAFAKGAFYRSRTICADGIASIQCVFSLVDHPDFRAPWVQLELPASGAGAEYLEVHAHLRGDEPRLEVSRAGDPVASGRSASTLRIDASAFAGRPVSVVVEPTRWTRSGVDVWVVHYPPSRSTQSLALPPTPEAFARRVREAAPRTVDVRVLTWSANVTAPWTVETCATTPRASIVSAPVTLDL